MNIDLYLNCFYLVSTAINLLTIPDIILSQILQINGFAILSTCTLVSLFGVTYGFFYCFS